MNIKILKNTSNKFSVSSLTIIFIVSIFCGSCSKKENAENQPNFIILFTDDQRFDALGIAGNKNISTPVLDSLCAQGMYFSQACVATSICSPSRAAVLTGRFGSANGVVSVGREGLHEQESTVFQYLKDAGYMTGIVGKWHLKNAPGSCGFDFSSYCLGNGTYYGRKYVHQDTEIIAETFIEDHNTNQSLTFIELSLKANKPFALFHCTQIPHMDHNFDWDVKETTQQLYHDRNLNPPPNWRDDLVNKPEYLLSSRSRQRALMYGYRDKDSLINHMERYYAAISEMDAALADLFSYLQNKELDTKTYILFMSDNGWFLGEHTFTSKVLAYEESIRVPFAVIGPGITSARSDALVMNIDIAPTMLDLAGLEVPSNMHGKSLVPILRGEISDVRNEIFYEAPESNLGSYPLFALRTKEWKYIQTYDNQDPSQLIFEEIYDLENDPYEINNLLGEEGITEKRAAFAGTIQGYRESIK